MCKELSDEIKRGMDAARNLVDHTLAMGADAGKIPVGGWIVEVRQPITDTERDMCHRALVRETDEKHRRHLAIVK